MKRLADQILELFEEAMDEYERLLRLELERAGLVISRWLAGFWQRKPCDDWLPEIEGIFAGLARDQLFVERESREAFIAWLAAVNAAATERAKQKNCEAVQSTQQPVTFDSLLPTREQAIRPADERHFPDDLPSPFDPACPQLRRAGNSIMQRHPPDAWLRLAERALKSYRVPEAIGKRFETWIAAEQRKIGSADKPAPVHLAFAGADQPPPQTPSQADSGGIEGDGAGDLRWIPFERFMENEGLLIYKTLDDTGAHWWKVPIKKIVFEGREVYDLRGSIEFHPTFVQSMILEHGGWVDDKGLEIILRHYIERYGSESQQQLLKDLASYDAGPSFKKFARAQLTELLLGLLVGKIAEKLAKIAKPAVRKALEKVNARLQRLAKRQKIPNRQELERELREITEDLRNVANKSTDAETKKAAQEIADEIEAEAKQAAKEAEKLGGTTPPAGSSGSKPTGTRSKESAPAQKPVNDSRPQHGSVPHDATAYNLGKKWENDAASVPGSVRFNQELVDVNGKVHPEFKPDVQRIRRTKDGRTVVDVYEVRSESQKDEFMNEKQRRYKQALGDQAGEVKWGEATKDAARQ